MSSYVILTIVIVAIVNLHLFLLLTGPWNNMAYLAIGLVMVVLYGLPIALTYTLEATHLAADSLALVSWTFYFTHLVINKPKDAQTIVCLVLAGASTFTSVGSYALMAYAKSFY